jgi:hypothetical protein
MSLIINITHLEKFPTENMGKLVGPIKDTYSRSREIRRIRFVPVISLASRIKNFKP